MKRRLPLAVVSIVAVVGAATLLITRGDRAREGTVLNGNQSPPSPNEEPASHIPATRAATARPSQAEENRSDRTPIPPPAPTDPGHLGRVLLPDGSPAESCEIGVSDCQESRRQEILEIDPDDLLDSLPPGAARHITDRSGAFPL